MTKPYNIVLYPFDKALVLEELRQSSVLPATASTEALVVAYACDAGERQRIAEALPLPKKKKDGFEKCENQTHAGQDSDNRLTALQETAPTPPPPTQAGAM